MRLRGGGSLRPAAPHFTTPTTCSDPFAVKGGRSSRLTYRSRRGGTLRRLEGGLPTACPWSSSGTHRCERLDICRRAKGRPSLLQEPAGQRPTAVFCANDLLALGLLFEVVHAGLNVPADLSIVGFDDISTASISAVPLTTIQQRRKELGSAAVRLLLDEIDPAQAE